MQSTSNPFAFPSSVFLLINFHSPLLPIFPFLSLLPVFFCWPSPPTILFFLPIFFQFSLLSVLPSPFFPLLTYLLSVSLSIFHAHISHPSVVVSSVHCLIFVSFYFKYSFSSRLQFSSTFLIYSFLSCFICSSFICSLVHYSSIFLTHTHMHIFFAFYSLLLIFIPSGLKMN